MESENRICDMHYLVDGDEGLRQCFYYSEYSAFICHECKKKPLKRFFYTVIKFISK